MGLSENSVPLNPMVNDQYPYEMAISLGIYPIFRQTQMLIGHKKPSSNGKATRLAEPSVLFLAPETRLTHLTEEIKNSKHHL